MRKHLALAVAATAVLAGCGGGESAGSADGKADLRMTIWTSNEEHLALFDEIAAGYTETHPDVTVKFDPIPFESYTTTLTTQIAGGNGPDLAWVLEDSAPDFVGSGALTPLTETLQKTEGYELDDLSDSATALWKNDGDLYAYPFSTSPFGVFVNNDLLKEAGQKSVTGDWTWDEAFATAAKVHEETGEAGIVVRDFDFKGWGNLATVWTGWGARAWSEDGKTCEFNRPPMVAAMTALHQAVFEDEAMPGPGTTADFFAGDAAMTITQISRASLLEEGAFDWDLVPLPSGPSGDYSVVGQAGLGVLKQGANVAAAEEFLAYFTSPENSEKLAQFFPPARTSQLSAETMAKSNPLLSPEQLQAVVVEGIEGGVVKPSHTDSAQIAQTVRSSLDPLWKPGADVQGVLDGVCQQITPLLGS
ncbi:ABC transporter substrate-binding protein [Kineosporia babensis]|uniref:Sugar ABC transporter substrate-binding protein n=1 Tax=Kineosporia babensis TaxID=499548 RepID=A0A9X1NLW0_9ACTN|nr:sugar ABC transporter substrate-binding protein [Kineosporia babensis]MCD5316111.1 sugar ABC transporter substrate-binding protein [Kineosporia babensis]